MINFKNTPKKEPFIKLLDFYNLALKANQSSIEAVNISSYSPSSLEVDSRYVNLKEVRGEEFIFFTNYNSPKALQFKSHEQVAATFLWSSISVQIRIKAKIYKKSQEFNSKYFAQRSIEKNALSISSNQSELIDAYDSIKKKYNISLQNDDLKVCPEYWGGYAFKPYRFEFWKGREFRLNERELFILRNGDWKKNILQP
jgi:pyridoxamine 5'-phosphate oxidase